MSPITVLDLHPGRAVRLSRRRAQNHRRQVRDRRRVDEVPRHLRASPHARPSAIGCSTLRRTAPLLLPHLHHRPRTVPDAAHPDAPWTHRAQRLGGPITMWATGGGIRCPHRAAANAIRGMRSRGHGSGSRMSPPTMSLSRLRQVHGRASAPHRYRYSTAWERLFPAGKNRGACSFPARLVLCALHPGGSRFFHDLVVVRGARLLATVQFTPRAQPFDGVQYPRNLLATRAVTVGLTRADPPAITVRSTPSGPVGDVALPAAPGDRSGGSATQTALCRSRAPMPCTHSAGSQPARTSNQAASPCRPGMRPLAG